MPALVSVNYLGDPEFEQALRDRVQQFMEPYEGEWVIRVLGSQTNTMWELKVEAPDGSRQWVTTLYGEEGSHSIDKILSELGKILEKR